jgi:hypothetical protein
MRKLLLGCAVLSCSLVVVNAGMPSMPRLATSLSLPQTQLRLNLNNPFRKKDGDEQDDDNKGQPEEKKSKSKKSGDDDPPLRGTRRQREEKEREEKRKQQKQQKASSSSSSSSSSGGDPRPNSMAAMARKHDTMMRRDIETGLRWYCNTAQGRNESLNLTAAGGLLPSSGAAGGGPPRHICATPVSGDNFLRAPSPAQLRFLKRVCSDAASPVLDSFLCRTIKSTTRLLQLKATVERGVRGFARHFSKVATLLYVNPLGGLFRGYLKRIARGESVSQSVSQSVSESNLCCSSFMLFSSS